MRYRIALLACALPVARIAGQVAPLSRSQAVQTALERGARVAVARADTAVANAALIGARVYPNPGLTATYSRAIPSYHFVVDLPIDLPGRRNLRVRSAELGLQAAQLRFQLAHATVALEADTTYTHAAAARAHSALSRRNALDADSLLHMVERRRDAGDASELDVALARVNAGQQANIASADSLTLISSLLDLQAVLGMASERVEITTSDSLTAPPAAATPGRTLAEAAANVSVESATLAAQLQHRSIFAAPSLTFGFEYGDKDQPGLLPTFGVGIGLPLFDRNRAPIAQAEAERVRAISELTLAQVEARNAIAHASREREIALAQVARDRVLVASADQVVAMSLTAYREGAAALPNVLEAQRNAREVLGKYVDDLANAWIATAELRVLALTPQTSQP